MVGHAQHWPTCLVVPKVCQNTRCQKSAGLMRAVSLFPSASVGAGESYKQVQGPEGHMGVSTIRLHPVEEDWVSAFQAVSKAR